MRPCPLCATPTLESVLTEAGWLELAVIDTLARAHPRWRRRDGACPACVQHALLHTLLERSRWLPDPANPYRRRDPFGGFDSVLTVPSAARALPAAPTPAHPPTPF